MAQQNPHRRLSTEIRAAIARGALTPDRAAHYLSKALDNPGQAGAVASVVAQLWGPGQGVPVAGDDEDGVLTSLWPGQQHIAAGTPRHPGAAYTHVQGYRAGAAPDLEDLREPPEIGPPDPEDVREGAEPGHGPMTAEHSHAHSSYSDDGPHSHAHIHRNDNLHAPGAGHGHQDLAMGGNAAVAAGIRRRTAEHTAAAAAMPRVEDMDDADVLRYMGRPPGR